MLPPSQPSARKVMTLICPAKFNHGPLVRPWQVRHSRLLHSVKHGNEERICQRRYRNIREKNQNLPRLKQFTQRGYDCQFFLQQPKFSWPPGWDASTTGFFFVPYSCAGALAILTHLLHPHPLGSASRTRPAGRNSYIIPITPRGLWRCPLIQRKTRHTPQTDSLQADHRSDLGTPFRVPPVVEFLAINWLIIGYRLRILIEPNSCVCHIRQDPVSACGTFPFWLEIPCSVRRKDLSLSRPCSPE